MQKRLGNSGKHLSSKMSQNPSFARVRHDSIAAIGDFENGEQKNEIDDARFLLRATMSAVFPARPR